jgi:hypothetical protein
MSIPTNLCRWCRKRISKGDGALVRRHKSGKKASLHAKCVKAWDNLCPRQGVLI